MVAEVRIDGRRSVRRIRYCNRFASLHISAIDQASQRTSPAEQVDHDHDESDDEQNVNKATQGIGSDEPKKPQHEQDNGNRIKHGMHLFVI